MRVRGEVVGAVVAEATEREMWTTSPAVPALASADEDSADEERAPVVLAPTIKKLSRQVGLQDGCVSVPTT
eukprot:6173207-Pleurochrysis_carterae.AAC.1